MPVYQTIREQANLHPQELAVVCGQETLTYSDLDQKSDDLAFLLYEMNIKAGDRVILLTEPGIQLIVTLLGILKARAVYIPISSLYPTDRIKTIYDTSGCKLLICDEIDQGLINHPDFRTLVIHKDALKSRQSVISIVSRPDDPAYILFTSGSTGVPKGAEILHRNLSYYTNWTASFFKKTVGNKLPLTSGINFAAAVSQIYSCLTTGETLHIVPGLLNNPEKLFNWYHQHPEYGLYCVPSVWQIALEWLKKSRQQLVIPPAALFLSGENIPEPLIENTFNIFPGLPVWNLYGPTEAVANLSYKKISSAKNITIGSPLPGTRFYVVKEDGLEAGVGEQGFLYASGPGICPGYVNDEALTKTTFFNYLSEDDGNVKVYNTGDIVQRIAENEYSFIGRKDQQVKINGQRIELLEIETKLNHHPAVSKAFVSISKQNSIIAHINTNEGAPVSISELRFFLLQFLTEAMIPEKWIFIGEIPTLPNGKTDRKALPLPTNYRPELSYPYLPPIQGKEQNIISAFERVLNISGIGMNDHFFDLGGNSLKAIALLSEIEERFNCRLPIQTLFEHPFPSSLLEFLPSVSDQSATCAGSSVQINKIPLTANQKSLSFFLQAFPGNTSYNIAYAIHFEGKPDTDRIIAALKYVISRNQSLHSVMKQEGEMTFFESDNRCEVKPEIEYPEHIDAFKREEYISKCISNLAACPFQLYNEPLYRIRLYRANNEKVILGFVVNHLIFDGASLPIFIGQLISYYKGQKPETEPFSLAEVFLKKDSYLSNNQHDRDLEFWRNYLKGVTQLHSFPELFHFEQSQLFCGGRASALIDSRTRTRLVDLCREKNITPNMLLLGSFAVTLFKFSAKNEYLIATPVLNRLTKAEQSMIGYFVNTVFCRIRCADDKNFDALINELKNDLLQILNHQQTPLAELLNILRGEGVNIPLSAFKVMFAYHEASEYSASTGSLQISAKEVFNQSAKCDIHLECFDFADHIELELTYDRSILNESAATQVVSLFQQVLNDVMSSYEAPLLDLGSVNPEEKELIKKYSIAEKTNFGRPLTLYHLFEESCNANPSLTAISFQKKKYNYLTLKELVNSCAVHLSTLGLNDREPIGIYMEHTPEMVVAILAASALAHPYVPLDPGYPVARNQYILDHADIRFVLANSGSDTEIFSPAQQIVFVDQVIGKNGQPGMFQAKVLPSDLLYIIYTSGSTGNPKGVKVPNKGVANYLLWMQTCFGANHGTKMLARTSISFDISVWELFLPLISGGTLLLEKRADIESPEQMARVIEENGATIAQFVPSGLKLFSDTGMLLKTPSLQKIFCGGEKMPLKLQNDVLSNFRGELYNLYGPTEASIFMSFHQCLPNSGHKNVPIGKPICNSSLYVLDKQKRLVPRGVPGDLYIGGEVLADGYLHDDDQTGKAFIAGTDEINEPVLYKTGDAGRMLFDGSFDFIGRNDTQVKIRGYRVELSEIESAVLQFPGIKQAVVYKIEYADDDVRLNVAVIGDASVTVENLKLSLRSTLPQYMVPSTVYLVDTIPLLPNGKVDTKAIEKIAPRTDTLSISSGENKLREDDAEKILYEIWTEVIGQNNFSLTDNFFDVGGHSILFLRIKEMIKEKTGADFSIVDLYQYPNIKSLAMQYRKKFEPSSSEILNSIRSRIENRKKRNYGNK